MSPTPKPASSLEIPPIASTGTAPSRASRTSSIIWPAFCSSTATRRAPAAPPASASAGDGPTRIPARAPEARPAQADGRAPGAKLARGVAREARERAERHHHEVGALAIGRREALLRARDRLVFVGEPLPERLRIDALDTLAHADRVQVAR